MCCPAGTGCRVCSGGELLVSVKKREKKFALASVKIAAWVGLCAAVLSAWTGDGSGYQVAQKQPMKLAAMEGYYEGRQGAGLVAFGLLNPPSRRRKTE